ncbi:MAG: hypothetical protein GKS04_04595 [Candidatus Mycalebacterium zealandia]|nr:MAG: hypothetical protein GKS04_04595 [Candidatus Mycalebacterium zealandia]
MSFPIHKLRKIKWQLFALCFLAVCLAWSQSPAELSRLGIFDKEKTPKIVVESFKWRAGGAGRRAIFSEVTLRNDDERDFSAIVLKARFSLKYGEPAGSTRGTIRKTLKAGETRTLKDVRLGIMNFDIDSVELEVVGATAASDGKPDHPLEVTAWDWRAAGQSVGTGTIESITVKNPAPEPYGKVEFVIVQKKAGEKIMTTSVPTEKIANARSETVYKEVNPGFIHPATDEIVVLIKSAYPVSRKQETLMRKKALDPHPEPDSNTPVPGYDVEVKKFEWGSGAAGSLGMVDYLVLKNRSSVRYAEITIAIDFLSNKKRVLTTNTFKIKNPPPPGGTRKYRNISIGILNVSPGKESVKVYVKGGKPARGGG